MHVPAPGGPIRIIRSCSAGDGEAGERAFSSRCFILSFSCFTSDFRYSSSSEGEATMARNKQRLWGSEERETWRTTESKSSMRTLSARTSQKTPHIYSQSISYSLLKSVVVADVDETILSCKMEDVRNVLNAEDGGWGTRQRK